MALFQYWRRTSNFKSRLWSLTKIWSFFGRVLEVIFLRRTSRELSEFFEGIFWENFLRKFSKKKIFLIDPLMVDGDEEEWNKQSRTISWLLANFLHVNRHMSSLDKQLPDQQSSDEPCSHLSSDDFLRAISWRWFESSSHRESHRKQELWSLLRGLNFQNLPQDQLSGNRRL